MTEPIEILEKPDKFFEENRKSIESMIKRIRKKREPKYKVSYVDIITLVNRECFMGEEYDKYIRWCNIKLRQGCFIIKI